MQAAPHLEPTGREREARLAAAASELFTTALCALCKCLFWGEGGAKRECWNSRPLLWATTKGMLELQDLTAKRMLELQAYTQTHTHTHKDYLGASRSLEPHCDLPGCRSGERSEVAASGAGIVEKVTMRHWLHRLGKMNGDTIA